MSIEQIMTRDPACCTPDTPLREVANLMLERDCGEIPVVDNLQDGKLVGVITDRDITCRAVAAGRNPGTTTASDIMTSDPVTLRPSADLDEAAEKLEQNQIRRLPVVDAQGKILGIVSQADIALRGNEQKVGEVVRDVSRPSPNGPGARA